MPNYELTKDGMVTRDKGIAQMFLSEYIISGTNGRSILHDIDMDDGFGIGRYNSESVTCVTKITIPYDALKAAIAPVEGEAFVEIGFGDIATDGLILYGANDTMTKPPVDKRLNWRVINMCQDYGDLRELLAAVERCG